MSLIMGGLLYWKAAAGKAADTTAAVQPAQTATEPIRDELPLIPPPPPPAPTETKPQQKTVPAKATGSVAAGACGGECTGAASPALRSALSARAGAARRCYERALRQNGILEGRMTIGVRVGSSGRVCSASVVSNSLGDPSVASCVVGLMRSANLPAATGGCVDVQVPMSFVSKM